MYSIRGVRQGHQVYLFLINLAKILKMNKDTRYIRDQISDITMSPVMTALHKLGFEMTQKCGPARYGLPYFVRPMKDALSDE